MTKAANLIYQGLLGENFWYAKRFNLYYVISNLITDCDDLIEKYALIYDENVTSLFKVPLVFNTPLNFKNSNVHIQYTTLSILLNEFKLELDELKQIKHFFEILLDIVNRNSSYIDAVQKTSCAAIILILSIIVGCFEFHNNFYNTDDVSLFIFVILSELSVIAGLCYTVKISIKEKQNIEQQLFYNLNLANRHLQKSDLLCFSEINDHISVKEEAYHNIKNNFERLEQLLYENFLIFKHPSCSENANIVNAFIKEQTHEDKATLIYF